MSYIHYLMIRYLSWNNFRKGCCCGFLFGNMCC